MASRDDEAQFGILVAFTAADATLLPLCLDVGAATLFVGLPWPRGPHQCEHIDGDEWCDGENTDELEQEPKLGEVNP